MSLKSNKFLCLLAWILPLAVVVPYAFFVYGFRALFWVWQNHYLPFWFALGLSVCLAALCNYLFMRANSWALWIFSATAILILIPPTYLAMHERRHMVLLVLFLEFLFLLLAAEWMRYVLHLPYYFSRRSWWESCPKSMPSIRAYLLRADGVRTSVRLSNLSEDGCFVFFENAALSPEVLKAPFIEIDFGNDSVFKAPIQKEFSTLDRLGAGFRFITSSLPGDWQKEFVDYINKLRRSGYAL